MKKNANSSILNIALSVFSILLIILGLYFIYLGIKDITNGNSITSVTTDNAVTHEDINVGISVTKAPESPAETQSVEKPTAQEKSLKTQEKIKATGIWIATDYVKGDITPGEYIVKQGDTLWEIAEAVYGDGYQWTKILDLNKAAIRKLPNGEQALIVPGQVLTIK